MEIWLFEDEDVISVADSTGFFAYNKGEGWIDTVPDKLVLNSTGDKRLIAKILWQAAKNDVNRGY